MHQMLWIGGMAVVFLSVCNVFAEEGGAPAAEVERRRIGREWGYLKARAEKAEGAFGQQGVTSRVVKEAGEALARCDAGDAGLMKERPRLAERRATLSARLLGLLEAPGGLYVSLSDAYERLGPAAMPAKTPVGAWRIVSLPEEHHAAGLTLANATAGPIACGIRLSHPPGTRFSFRVRHQVFLENKGGARRRRMVDPLALLKQKRGVWGMTLEPGQVVRLYVGMQIPRNLPGPATVIFRVESSARLAVELPVTIEMLAAEKPDAAHFEYMAFMYFRKRDIASRMPELSAADLGDHGATAIEFCQALPSVKFHADGRIASIDFARHDRFVRAYKPRIRRLMMFWQSIYHQFECTDGTRLKPYSQPWERALSNLLRAWWSHAKQLGCQADNFGLYLFDEPAGAERTQQAVSLYRLARKAIGREIPCFTTICDYTSVAETAALASEADILVAGLEYRPALPKHKIASWSKRFALDYNPLKAWKANILPALRARQAAGLQFGSYHVTGGKVDDVMAWYRAYPLRMAAMGLTWGGHWAYNETHGSSWDDFDGRRQDMSLIYDGTEEHAINRRVNPSREPIVPSIRWEALRAGLQDGRILAHLKALCDRGGASADVRTSVRAMLDEIRQAEKQPRRPTPAALRELSVRLRKTLVSVRSGRAR